LESTNDRRLTGEILAEEGNFTAAREDKGVFYYSTCERGELALKGFLQV